MQFDLLPYQNPFNLFLRIKAIRPVRLIVSIFNPENNAQFIYRRIKVSGTKKIRFKLPIASRKMRVQISSKDLPLGDAYYIIENIEIKRDTKCPVGLTDRDKRFIKFIQWFAKELNELKAGLKGTIYQSDEFSILLLDRIIEDEKEVSTPARIGKSSGIIQVSKNKIKDYTVPMIMVMLLHEYAHRYKNEEYGRVPSNELSADLIAINITLNLGFDASEILNCFKTVFSSQQTPMNQKRWRAIRAFVKRFRATEKQRCSTSKTK